MAHSCPPQYCGILSERSGIDPSHIGGQSTAWVGRSVFKGQKIVRRMRARRMARHPPLRRCSSYAVARYHGGPLLAVLMQAVHTTRPTPWPPPICPEVPVISLAGSGTWQPTWPHARTPTCTTSRCDAVGAPSKGATAFNTENQTLHVGSIMAPTKQMTQQVLKQNSMKKIWAMLTLPMPTRRSHPP